MVTKLIGRPAARRAGLLGCLTLSLFLGIARAARAEGDPRVALIAPYVDETTLVVARLDTTTVDPDAMVAWLVGSMKAGNAPKELLDHMNTDSADFKAKSKAWLAGFKKAGGRSVYLLATLDPKNPVVLVAPLETPDADPKAIAAMLKTPAPKPGEGPSARGRRT